MLYLLIETYSGNDKVISHSVDPLDLKDMIRINPTRAREESWFIIPEHEYDGEYILNNSGQIRVN